MFEKRVYTESEITNIVKPPYGALSINDINEFLLVNLRHYSTEKNYRVIHELFWFTLHIISYLNDESDFKNSIKLSCALEIYINEDNVGLSDYLRFVSNHSYLLYVTNDFMRLYFFASDFSYFMNVNKNNLIKFVKKELISGDSFKNSFLFVLRQVVSIFAFFHTVSNNIGSSSYAGDCFYWKKYYEGLIFLNCSRSSIYNEIIRRADYVSTSNKLTNVMVEANFTKIQKAFNYLRGICNRFIFITTGFGEKPIRVIMTMIFTIFFFSFLYHCLQLTNTSYYLHNLFFSLFAFTSFGLYQPLESQIILATDSVISMSILALEIILGILLNGIFIVSLSRKIMR